MGRKSQYSIEEKIQIINEYQNGEKSFTDIYTKYGLAYTTLRKWEYIYETEGRLGFEVKQANACYSRELKESAIHDYLNGVGSYRELCKKYRIPSITTLDNWVKKYNGYEKLKDYEYLQRNNTEIRKENERLKQTYRYY